MSGFTNPWSLINLTPNFDAFVCVLFYQIKVILFLMSDKCFKQ